MTGQLVLLCLSALLAAISQPNVAGAAGPTPTRHELAPPPGMYNARAASINDAGVIAGWAMWGADGSDQRARDQRRATVWIPEGAGGEPVPHELPDLAGATGLEGGESAAYGINRAGQIVGYCWMSQHDRFAVMWTPSANGSYGAPTNLSTGLFDSSALAINNATQDHPLQIVGWATPTPSSAASQAVLWTPAPGGSFVVTDLSPPGGRNEVGQGGPVPSLATAINDSGQIAGNIVAVRNPFPSPDPFHPMELVSHAVAWIPSPAPGGLAATGIPTSPAAAAATSSTYLPIPLDTSTTNVDANLGQVNSPLATTPVSSYAFGINNAGQIVGSGGDRAVVWSKLNPALPYTATPLPELGIGNQALAINKKGQIVGLLRTGGLLAPYLVAYGWPGTSVSGDGGTGTAVPAIWTPSPTDGSYGPPTLAATDPDGLYGAARDINTQGRIVGEVHQLDRVDGENNDFLGFHAEFWQQPPMPAPPPTGSGPPPPPDGAVPGGPGSLGNDGSATSTSSSRSQPHLRVAPVTGVLASQTAASPPSPLAGQALKAIPAAGINLVAGSRTAGPLPHSDEAGSFPFARDTFVAMLTAMVLVPTGLLALGWVGWHRGWLAAARRRLKAIRTPQHIRQSSW